MSFLQVILFQDEIYLDWQSVDGKDDQMCMIQKQKTSKPFTSLCSCFCSLLLESGGGPSVLTVPHMDQTQWLCMYYRAQNPVSRESLGMMITYKSYCNALSNPPSLILLALFLPDMVWNER